jgi:hypothetical protein
VSESTKTRKPSLTNKVADQLTRLVELLGDVKTGVAPARALEDREVKRGIEYLSDLVAWHKAARTTEGSETDAAS